MEQLLDIIRELPETVHQLLLVGHNPGLERLILSQLSINDEDRFTQRIAQGFPTGAFALVELPQERWNTVGPGSGKILELILPKDPD